MGAEEMLLQALSARVGAAAAAERLCLRTSRQLRSCSTLTLHRSRTEEPTKEHANFKFKLLLHRETNQDET